MIIYAVVLIPKCITISSASNFGLNFHLNSWQMIFFVFQSGKMWYDVISYTMTLKNTP